MISLALSLDLGVGFARLTVSVHEHSFSEVRQCPPVLLKLMCAVFLFTLSCAVFGRALFWRFPVTFWPFFGASLDTFPTLHGVLSSHFPFVKLSSATLSRYADVFKRFIFFLLWPSFILLPYFSCHRELVLCKYFHA